MGEPQLTRGGGQTSAPGVSAQNMAGQLLEQPLQMPFGVAGFGGNIVQRQRLVEVCFNPGQQLRNYLLLIHGASLLIIVPAARAGVVPAHGPVAHWPPPSPDNPRNGWRNRQTLPPPLGACRPARSAPYL
ncbi:hypothetical protein D3C76_1488150 [compost metagenome]